MWLLPFVSGLRLERASVLLNAANATAVVRTVLQVDFEVATVDFQKLATHPDFLASTQTQVESFVHRKVCYPDAPAEGLWTPDANATDGNATEGNATALLLKHIRWARLPAENATAAGNVSDAVADSPAVEAVEQAINASGAAKEGLLCPAVKDVHVRLYGNPFHVRIEAAYNEDVHAAFASPEFPKELSDFLLSVPPILLFSPEPPIVHDADVQKVEVESVIPKCEAHLPGMLKELSRAYTNRMLPFALDGACSSFMTTLSFSPGATVTEEDRAFCETVSKKLMREHFVGNREFEDWCVEVCERRNGPVALCARPEA